MRVIVVFISPSQGSDDVAFIYITPANTRAAHTAVRPGSVPRARGESQGRGGEEELGTELYSQEFPINKQL